MFGFADEMKQEYREETSLIAKAKKGNLDAFGELLSSEEAKLFRVAFLLCGEREEARDLLQETFLAIWQALPRFSGRSSFYTYSYRILLNIHHKRRRKRRILLPFLEGIKVKTRLLSPAESFKKEEKRERVREAIAKLPSIFQEVILLCYLEELSYREIAERLGLKEGTIKSRLFKAKKLLRCHCERMK